MEKTYDQLREEGYIQYIVMLSRGTYEGSSIPTIVFYVLLKEDKSATEVADLFKVAFKDYVAAVNENHYVDNRSARECFNYLFKMQWHEAAEFDWLEQHGWDNNPHFHIPVKKIVTLQGMEDYLEDEPHGYLFNNRNLNGLVSSEVFNIHSVDSPNF